MSLLVLSDSALVANARRGDKHAFAALVERHYATMFATCRRMLGDAELARDAAQEAVIRAMLGLDALRDDERFGAWLIGIALNVSRSLAGGRRQASSLEAWLEARTAEQPAAPGPGPADRAQTTELAGRVHAAIAQLPAGQRQAVVLFYLAGLTHAEIAQEVGSRPGAIKTRLHKARIALRASLAELHEERTPMTESPTDLIPMRIADLRRSAADDPARARHIVFLQEAGGNRQLRIWIGPSEASALAATLDDVALPRPGVHQFAAALLTAAGTRLREVRITELTEFTFYAQAVLADGSIVDARPSDALTLALVTPAPIYVRSAVLDQSANQSEMLRDLIEEADSAPDAARAIADEIRARLAATAEELAARGRQAAADGPKR